MQTAKDIKKNHYGIKPWKAQFILFLIISFKCKKEIVILMR